MTKNDELPKVIYVMGAPGAGKGTQAKMLAAKIKYHQFSTGNAIRELRSQETPLGRRIKEVYDKGLLQPPELAAEIVIKAIRDHVGNGHGLVFDGTPRTIKESDEVDKYFVEQGYGKPLAIYIRVDKEEMIKRNSKRRFCFGVKSDFPVFSKEDEKRCREMGGEVGTRPDDNPKALTTRWDEFMEQTYPVVEKYRARGIVKEIDGMKSIEDVYEQIMRIIESLK